MKRWVIGVFVFVLCLSLSMLVLEAAGRAGRVGDNDPGLNDGDIVTLTDPEENPVISVAVNSFGQAGKTAECLYPGIGDGFRVMDDASPLCVHEDFISYLSGGYTRVQPIRPSIVRPSGCEIISPIDKDAANHAVSVVLCGDCLMRYEHTVDAKSLSWNTNVYISGCPMSCFFSYTDYNVNGYTGNGASWQEKAGGYLGRFVVRNNSAETSDPKYLFTDISGAGFWQQNEFPSLLDLLDNPLRLDRDCPTFSPGERLFSSKPGDWTGGLKWVFSDVAQDDVNIISYSHSRDDKASYP